MRIFWLTLCLWLLSCVADAQSIWKRHVIDDSSKGADGVRLADFDHDDKLDIVTGWEQGGITRLYLQPDRTRLKTKWPAVTVGEASSVEDAVAVDIDGDGHLDVVSSTEGRTQTLFVHWAPSATGQLLHSSSWKTEAFPQSVKAQAWMYCIPMDVDGKNGVDLIAGSKNPNGAVGWWESPSDPRRLEDWKYHKLIDAGWIMSLIAHDVDFDGDLDILLTDRKGESRGVKWLERPSAENVTDEDAWKEHVIGGTNKEMMFGVLRDLDQDGTEDLVVATRNGTTDLFRRIPGHGKPTWELRTVPNPFGYEHGKSLTVADLDRDGRLDLAQTLRCVPINSPAVVMMRHDGRPFHGEWTVADIGGPDGSKFDLIEPIDLDADGDLDLITCEEVSNLGVFWYENPTL